MQERETTQIKAIADPVTWGDSFKMWDPQTVLLAQADPTQILATYAAFVGAGLPNGLQVVATTEQAIAYLTRQGGYRSHRRYPFPVLLLLDLELGKKRALGLLEWQRRQASLRNFPVALLANSHSDPELRAGLELGAVSYLVKPLEPKSVHELVRRLDRRWLLQGEFPEPTAKAEVYPASQGLPR